MDWDFEKTDWYVVTPLGSPPSQQDTFTDMRPETSSWKFGFIQRDDKRAQYYRERFGKLKFRALPFVRQNKGIVTVCCCPFLWDGGGALPLVEIWWREFVSKLMEWKAFIDSLWIITVYLILSRFLRLSVFPWCRDLCGSLIVILWWGSWIYSQTITKKLTTLTLILGPYK